jgi:8-oxo-dGTP pyrophosphatase MutT (NUDIX family)
LRVNRHTARVLPVDREGRVLVQLGRDRFPRDERYWLTIGGGKTREETLAQAGAREMREETGIDVDPGSLGEPIGTTVVEYSAFGLVPVRQYQTYFALAVDDAEVSPRHQSLIERLGIERHEWLTPGELERRPERLADRELPRLMRTAVTAVRGDGTSDDTSGVPAS